VSWRLLQWISVCAQASLLQHETHLMKYRHHHCLRSSKSKVAKAHEMLQRLQQQVTCVRHVYIVYSS
jgi:hypothetical protein